MPVIPATLEAKAEDHKFKASPAKLVRPCDRNKIKTKGKRARAMT
jgi:hypothetical protein